MTKPPSNSGTQHARAPRLRHALGMLAACVGAVAALLFGMSIPSHFRSISPLVLEAATVGTPTLGQAAAAYIDAGQPGMAQPLLRLLPKQSKARLDAAARMGDLLEQHPLYRWSGGPTPFYETFLTNAPHLRADEPFVLPSLLPGDHRRYLAQFLSASPNQNVHRILATRELSGWQIFYPVFSTSGQPLEAAILSAALLEQSSALSAPLRSDLLASIDGALNGNAHAQSQLEAVYAALLTIGRHSNWLQLEHLVQQAPDRQALLFHAAAIQEAPDRFDLLFAASHFNADPGVMAPYIQRHGDVGWRAIATAVTMGEGALQTLLDNGKPLYHPPQFWYRLPQLIRSGQENLKGFAESMPQTALVIRVGAFALCGFFLVGMLRGIILGPAHRGPRSRTLWQIDRVVGAVLVMLLVWVLIEPGLLQFNPNKHGTLEIQLAQLLPTPQSDSTSLNMIDQVTIIVLLLFFVMQLFVFFFGLLKIAEIRRHAAPSELKLQLLDNEENLFDLGLYIGLGGTVGSLILVVLQFVDASLMAAYASTLFGIIFVAILKVGFLRPFRRSLLMQCASDATPTGNAP